MTELKEDFQLVDYDRIWEEVRGRTQRTYESMGKYVAVITNYLNGLPTEEEQLGVLRKNMLPYYIDRLMLHEIGAVKDLIRFGRCLEDAKYKIVNHRSRTMGGGQPELSYPPIS